MRVLLFSFEVLRWLLSLLALGEADFNSDELVTDFSFWLILFSFTEDFFMKFNYFGSTLVTIELCSKTTLLLNLMREIGKYPFIRGLFP